MSSKKKRTVALAALVVVLAAVIVGLILVKNRKEETEPYVSTTVSLVSEDSQTITSLSFGKIGGDELSFTHADYSWTYTGDETFPVNGTVLDEMASAVSSVTALRTIEGEVKDEYGLGDGAIHISAKFPDHPLIELTIGALNSYNSNTYIMTGDGKIYMFSDSLTEHFAKELKDLIQLDDPEATVDTNYLVALDVSDGAGRKNSITDTAGMRELFDQSDAYTCLDWVEYAVSDERFAEYGITPDSARLTINYKAAQAVTDADGNDSTIRVEEAYEIIFGDHVTEEGENGESTESVYYTVTGSTIVYKAPVADFDATMAYLDYVPEDETAGDATADAEAQTETDASTEAVTD